MQILSYSKRFTKKVILLTLLVNLSFLCGCNGCCSTHSTGPFKIVNKIHNNQWVDKSGSVSVIYSNQYYLVVSRTNSCGQAEVRTYQTSSNQYFTVKAGDIWIKNQ